MRTIRYTFAILFAVLVITLSAQQWDQINGSMQVRSGPSAPLVIIDQTASGQKILSLRANGTEVWSNTSIAVTSTVPILIPDGTAAAPSLALATEPTSGWYNPTSHAGAWVYVPSTGAGVGKFMVLSSYVGLSSATSLAWSSTTDVEATADLILSREAAAVLQIGDDAAGVTNQLFKGPDRITSDGVGGNLTFAGGRNRGASAGGSIIFQTSPAAGAGVTGTLATAVAIGSTGVFTTVGTIAAAGRGVPAIYGYGDAATVTNQGTAAIATYTVGAADATFEVGANCLVTTATTHSFSLDVTYTDESNVARTMILPVAALAGSFITGGLITNITGAGPYEAATMTIRAKAATAITVRTSAGGTFTAVVYNARGSIKQIS